MPLTRCPDCGRRISTAAPACPHCGRPAQAAPAATRPALPSLRKTTAGKGSLFRKVPKTVWAISAAVVPGFFVGLFMDEKISSDPLLNSLLNGVIGALGYAVCVAYIAALIICGMKGKPVFVTIGIILFFVPAMSIWPVIGAIRIAKPNSTWARRYYGAKKLQIADARFATTASNRPKRGWVIAAVLLVMLLVALALLVVSKRHSLQKSRLCANVPDFSARPSATVAQRIVQGKSINYSVRLPEGWTVEQEERYDYDLLMSAENQAICVGVVAENQNFGNIDEFIDNAQQYMRSVDAAAKFSDVAPITIDDRIWRTFRVQCRLPNGIPTVQEVCIYTGPEGTFQLVGWTSADRFDRSTGKLREIIHSFKFPAKEPR
jgi:hypothetical protein